MTASIEPGPKSVKLRVIADLISTGSYVAREYPREAAAYFEARALELLDVDDRTARAIMRLRIETAQAGLADGDALRFAVRYQGPVAGGYFRAAICRSEDVHYVVNGDPGPEGLAWPFATQEQIVRALEWLGVETAEEIPRAPEALNGFSCDAELVG